MLSSEQSLLPAPVKSPSSSLLSLESQNREINHFAKHFADRLLSLNRPLLELKAVLPNSPGLFSNYLLPLLQFSERLAYLSQLLDLITSNSAANFPFLLAWLDSSVSSQSDFAGASKFATTLSAWLSTASLNVLDRARIDDALSSLNSRFPFMSSREAEILQAFTLRTSSLPASSAQELSSLNLGDIANTLHAWSSALWTRVRPADLIQFTVTPPPDRSGCRAFSSIMAVKDQAKKLKRWTQRQLQHKISCPQAEQDLLIAQLTSLCLLCRKLGDFHSAIAISSGLSNEAIALLDLPHLSRTIALTRLASLRTLVDRENRYRHYEEEVRARNVAFKTFIPSLRVITNLLVALALSASSLQALTVDLCSFFEVHLQGILIPSIELADSHVLSYLRDRIEFAPTTLSPFSPSSPSSHSTTTTTAASNAESDALHRSLSGSNHHLPHLFKSKKAPKEKPASVSASASSDAADLSRVFLNAEYLRAAPPSRWAAILASATEALHRFVREQQYSHPTVVEASVLSELKDVFFETAGEQCVVVSKFVHAVVTLDHLPATQVLAQRFTALLQGLALLYLCTSPNPLSSDANFHAYEMITKCLPLNDDSSEVCPISALYRYCGVRKCIRVLCGLISAAKHLALVLSAIPPNEKDLSWLRATILSPNAQATPQEDQFVFAEIFGDMDLCVTLTAAQLIAQLQAPTPGFTSLCSSSERLGVHVSFHAKKKDRFTYHSLLSQFAFHPPGLEYIAGFKLEGLSEEEFFEFIEAIAPIQTISSLAFDALPATSFSRVFQCLSPINFSITNLEFKQHKKSEKESHLLSHFVRSNLNIPSPQETSVCPIVLSSRLIKSIASLSFPSALINSIDLSDNMIQQFPEELLNCKSLRILNMRKNQIAVLPPAISVLSLVHIDLGFNRLQKLPHALALIRSLQHLHLDNNRLRKLPESLAFLPQLKVNLIGNPGLERLFPPDTPPAEWWEHWTSATLSSNHRLGMAKLIVLGDGNVGKSSLIRALKFYDALPEGHSGGPINSTGPNVATDGVDWGKWKVNSGLLSDGRHLIFNVLDCAGQSVYHATHVRFMCPNSVYLVVFDLSKPFETAKIEFWLNLLTQKLPKAAIYVIGTHADTFSQPAALQSIVDRMTRHLTQKFPSVIKVLSISSTRGDGLTAFLPMLVGTALKLPRVESTIPLNYKAMHQMLKAYSTSQSDRVVISETDFLSLSRCVSLNPTDIREVREILVATGRLVSPGYERNGTEMAQLCILSPAWLADLFASVISLKSSFVKANGLLRKSDLVHIWRPPFLKNDQFFPLCISILEHYDAVVECESLDSLFVPMRVTVLDPDFRSILLWNSAGTAEVTQVYSCEFLPPGFFGYILSRFLLAYRHIFTLSSCWVRGCLIVVDSSSSLILFEVNEEINTMAVRIRGPGAADLMVRISQDLHHLLPELLFHPYDVLISCPSCCALPTPSQETIPLLLDKFAPPKLDFPALADPSVLIDSDFGKDGFTSSLRANGFSLIRSVDLNDSTSNRLTLLRLITWLLFVTSQKKEKQSESLFGKKSIAKAISPAATQLLSGMSVTSTGKSVSFDLDFQNVTTSVPRSFWMFLGMTPHLTSLSIHHISTPLFPQMADLFLSLLDSSLQRLEISHTKQLPVVWDYLFSLLPHYHALKSLALVDVGLTDASALQLIHVLYPAQLNPHSIALDLRDNSLTSEFMGALSALMSQNIAIHDLQLSGNPGYSTFSVNTLTIQFHEERNLSLFIALDAIFQKVSVKLDEHRESQLKFLRDILAEIQQIDPTLHSIKNPDLLFFYHTNQLFFSKSQRQQSAPTVCRTLYNSFLTANPPFKLSIKLPSMEQLSPERRPSVRLFRESLLRTHHQLIEMLYRKYRNCSVAQILSKSGVGSSIASKGSREHSGSSESIGELTSSFSIDLFPPDDSYSGDSSMPQRSPSMETPLLYSAAPSPSSSIFSTSSSSSTLSPDAELNPQHSPLLSLSPSSGSDSALNQGLSLSLPAVPSTPSGSPASATNSAPPSLFNSLASSDQSPASLSLTIGNAQPAEEDFIGDNRKSRIGATPRFRTARPDSDSFAAVSFEYLDIVLAAKSSSAASGKSESAKQMQPLIAGYLGEVAQSCGSMFIVSLLELYKTRLSNLRLSNFGTKGVQHALLSIINELVAFFGIVRLDKNVESALEKILSIYRMTKTSFPLKKRYFFPLLPLATRFVASTLLQLKISIRPHREYFTVLLKKSRLSAIPFVASVDGMRYSHAYTIDDFLRALSRYIPAGKESQLSIFHWGIEEGLIVPLLPTAPVTWSNFSDSSSYFRFPQVPHESRISPSIDLLMLTLDIRLNVESDPSLIDQANVFLQSAVLRFLRVYPYASSDIANALLQELVDRGMLIAFQCDPSTPLSDIRRLMISADVERSLSMILSKQLFVHPLLTRKIIFNPASSAFTTPCCGAQFDPCLLAPDLTLCYSGAFPPIDDVAGLIASGKEIGRGAFGVVYKVTVGGVDRALKVSLTSDSFDTVYNEFISEIILAATLRTCPYLVSVLSVSLPHLAQLIEFMPLGDLYAYIGSQPKPPLQTALAMCVDVAQGLLFMHSRSPPIVHLDMKSPNILLSISPSGAIIAKLADFGLSRVLGLSTSIKLSKNDNCTWMAPEMLTGTQASLHTDVYALGIILWEIIMWSQPFPNFVWMSELETQIIQGLRPPFPPAEELSDELQTMATLIRSAWSALPSDRPKASLFVETLTPLQDPEFRNEAPLYNAPPESSSRALRLQFMSQLSSAELILVNAQVDPSSSLFPDLVPAEPDLFPPSPVVSECSSDSISDPSLPSGIPMPKSDSPRSESSIPKGIPLGSSPSSSSLAPTSSSMITTIISESSGGSSETAANTPTNTPTSRMRSYSSSPSSSPPSSPSSSSVGLPRGIRPRNLH